MAFASVIRFLLVVANCHVFAAPAFPPSARGVWKWVEIEGSTCMNGKSTGVWYRRGHEGNEGLVVWMEGGGACFNLETCDTAAHNSHPGNPGSHGQTFLLELASCSVALNTNCRVQCSCICM